MSDELSKDARRTARNNGMIARGKHPRTALPLLDNGESCGTCVHAGRYVHNSRSYFKCDLIPVTRGPGTDIRLSWPACLKWEERKQIQETHFPPPVSPKAPVVRATVDWSAAVSDKKGP